MVITVCDTPPYGHAPTYQINTIKKTIIWPWGQRSRSHEGHYGTWHCLMVMHPHTKYHWPISIFDLEVKGQGPAKVITVCDTPPYGHAPIYQISLTYLERQKSYGPYKLRWEEAEEKIRLKQYVSLGSKGRHNYSTKLNFR